MGGLLVFCQTCRAPKAPKGKKVPGPILFFLIVFLFFFGGRFFGAQKKKLMAPPGSPPPSFENEMGFLINGFLGAHANITSPLKIYPKEFLK